MSQTMSTYQSLQEASRRKRLREQADKKKADERMHRLEVLKLIGPSSGTAEHIQTMETPKNKPDAPLNLNPNAQPNVDIKSPVFPDLPLANTVSKPNIETLPKSDTVKPYADKLTERSVSFDKDSNSYKYGEFNLTVPEYEMLERIKQGKGSGNPITPNVQAILDAEMAESAQHYYNTQRESEFRQSEMEKKFLEQTGRAVPEMSGASPDQLAQVGNMGQVDPLQQQPGLNFGGVNISTPALTQIAMKVVAGVASGAAAGAGLGSFAAGIGAIPGAIAGGIVGGVGVAFFALSNIREDQLQDVKVARDTFNAISQNLRVYNNMALAGVPPDIVIGGFNEQLAKIEQQQLYLENKGRTSWGEDLAKTQDDLAVIYSWKQTVLPMMVSELRTSLAAPDPNKMTDLSAFSGGTDYGM